jgi:hypothetical protein
MVFHCDRIFIKGDPPSRSIFEPICTLVHIFQSAVQKCPRYSEFDRLEAKFSNLRRRSRNLAKDDFGDGDSGRNPRLDGTILPYGYKGLGITLPPRTRLNRTGLQLRQAWMISFAACDSGASKTAIKRGNFRSFEMAPREYF